MFSLFRKKPKVSCIRLKRGYSSQLSKTSFLDGEIAVVKDVKQLIVCIDNELYTVKLTKLEK